jgi:DNA-binding MarR family transcriptional regulator
MKQNINTSITLIEQAATERWIKPLALFHLLKLTYGNSVIYNYRKRMKELAERFGIARKTLYNYLDILRSKELIDKNKGDSKNLHLTSIRNLKSYSIKKNARLQFQLMMIFKLFHANFIQNSSKIILGKWPLTEL